MKQNPIPILISLFAIVAAFILPACANTNTGQPKVSVDLVDGACVKSDDGRHAVCYNPLTHVLTVKALESNSLLTELRYDAESKEWRGTAPDGTTAIYANGKLRIEPPLPLPAAQPPDGTIQTADPPPK